MGSLWLESCKTTLQSSLDLLRRYIRDYRSKKVRLHATKQGLSEMTNISRDTAQESMNHKPDIWSELSVATIFGGLIAGIITGVGKRTIACVFLRIQSRDWCFLHKG